MMNEPIVFYKRQEGFRFVFKQPIRGTFAIQRINNQRIESNEGSIEILDMSLGGMKFTSFLDLPLDQRVLLLVKFQIEEEKFSVTGKIMWKKAKMEKGYFYGFEMDKDSYSEDLLLEQLKILSVKQGNC